MNYNNNRKSVNDDVKIRQRFIAKCEEYKLKPLDELRTIFRESRISSTDRRALVFVVDSILKEQMAKNLKELEDNGKEEE